MDTDGDGLPDALELTLGSNPYSKDSDLDGLDDGSEYYVHFTDVLNPDTDGDTLAGRWV